jgi:hypothetical protein
MASCVLLIKIFNAISADFFGPKTMLCLSNVQEGEGEKEAIPITLFL